MMDYLGEEYGFDAKFMQEVPEYLKCVMCHLVMRNPVQIMTCGHRFCSPCFERVKGYSHHLNKELCCPIDRETIDISKVFSDTGIERDIGNLQVKCSGNARGCGWTGDLRGLQSHKDQCQYDESKTLHNQSVIQGVEGDTCLLKELLKRVGKCEYALSEKEKEIAFVKFNLHEMNNSFHEKDAEIDSLKIQNNKIEEEMKMMKDNQWEFKHQVEIKMENLSLKNQLLENKAGSIENQLFVAKQQLQDQQEDIKSIKRSIEDVSNPSENVKFELSEPFMELQCTVDSEIKKVNDETNNVNTQIRDAGKYVEELLSKKTDEFHNVAMKEDEVKSNDVVVDEIQEKCLVENLQSDMEEVKMKIAILQANITNVENILFCDASSGSKDIVLHWKLQNYQYYFDIGEPVYSPIFLTQMKGYGFGLRLKWSGDLKENLGLFISLHRGVGYEVLEPFNMQVRMEIYDDKGNKVSKIMTLATIEANRETYFSISPGTNTSKDAIGYTRMLTMPQLNNYIVNDILSIKCRIIPP